MPAKKQTAARKDKVIGIRVTPSETAAIEILRGNLAPGTWAAGIIRRELDKARADGRL